MLHYTQSGCREESTLESYSVGYEWFPVKSFYQVSESDLTLSFLGASLVAQMVKNPPAMLETWVPSLGWEDSLEEGMAAHSSILAWRIPQTEEPGGYSPWSCKKSAWLKRLSQAHRAELCKQSEVFRVNFFFLEWNSNYNIQLWKWWTFDFKIFTGSYITN